MDILYASDENYVRHAAASMLSLLDTNRGVPSLTVHYISMGVSVESRERLKALAAGYGRELRFHELGDLNQWFDFSFNTRGFAPATLARLFVARIVPREVTRVIYIDCDTVVLDDLTPLWETDMRGCVLGMVSEPTANKKRRRYLGMPDGAPYFNAGILLIDIARWRAEHTEETVLGFYKRYGGDLTAPDQDAINGSLVGHIAELQPRWNYGSVQLYYPWRTQKRISAPAPFMSEAAYRAGTEKPAIVHFLGEERPWRAGNRHPYAHVYEQYLAMTPWAGTPQEQGWQTYFRAFYLGNALSRPFPYLRWIVIDSLIPLVMKRREKQRAKQAAKQDAQP